MPEALRSSLLIDFRPPMDAPLFAKLHEVPAYDRSVAEQLLPGGDRLADEKENFYRHGRTDNPDLRPDTIDLDKVSAREDGLLEFRGWLAGQDAHPDVIDLYRWRVDDLLGQNRLLRAAAEGNSDQFAVQNIYAYGEPDTQVFRSTAVWFRQRAEGLLEDRSVRGGVRAAASEVKELFQDVPEGTAALLPDAELFNTVRDLHFREGGYFALLLAGVELPRGGKITPDIGEPALRQILHNIGADSYKRVKNPSGDYWGMSHTRQELMGPLDYGMSWEKFVGLPAGHEVGSHTLEYMNGRRSGLLLLSAGLDRYSRGNEGRAVMREQIVHETPEAFTELLRWQDITRRHLASAIGAGLLGRTMDYSDTYAAINAVDRLWSRDRKPGDIEAADVAAHRRTWLLMQRVYKGTSGTGLPFQEYKLYLEGLVRGWQTAKTHPELIEREGDKGKYDISNERHVGRLVSLGILTLSNA
jgi:hypothetical protein